jgi:arginyl-tRNA synthetase
VYLLGADHHGYVRRLRALAAIAGDDPDEHIEVLIGQLVNLVRGGEPVKLSKRAGNIITLDEVVDAVGVDAARYALARSSADSPLTLDIEEITRRARENPVHYVQYVAARTASVSRNAADAGVRRGDGFDPGLLSGSKEQSLLRAIGDYPGVVATAAELREPHRVARYLEDLAGTYHRFYDECRILPRGDEPVTELMRARLWLNDATRIVIENGLDLLGVVAAERM